MTFTPLPCMGDISVFVKQGIYFYVCGVLIRIQLLALDACEFSAVRQPGLLPRISRAVPTRWRDWGWGGEGRGGVGWGGLGTNYWGPAGLTVLHMFLSFLMVSLFFGCTF